MKTMDQLPTLANAPAPLELSVPYVSQDAALIAARFDDAALTGRSLIWEVFEQDAVDPVRYGLCLVKADGEPEVRIPVMGLMPGRAYRYRFLDGVKSSPEGRFITAAQHGANRAA